MTSICRLRPIGQNGVDLFLNQFMTPKRTLVTLLNTDSQLKKTFMQNNKPLNKSDKNVISLGNLFRRKFLNFILTFFLKLNLKKFNLKLFIQVVHLGSF